jgi:carbamoyl-phosphate synthase small subunit
VTTKNIYTWQQSIWDSATNSYPEIAKEQLQHHVVVYDFGVKKNIMRMLVARGCYLTVVPATTTAEEVLALKPKGILLSNGPGDPEPCDYAITAIKQLLINKVPMLGICLGHQLLAIAKGAKTEKMKFGHHGANHPVQDLTTKKVFISSQNHGFAVKADTLPKDVKVTHTSLFDGSLQGIECVKSKAIGFQGHPEASPGPQDLNTIFNKFITFLNCK